MKYPHTLTMSPQKRIRIQQFLNKCSIIQSVQNPISEGVFITKIMSLDKVPSDIRSHSKMTIKAYCEKLSEINTSYRNVGTHSISTAGYDYMLERLKAHLHRDDGVGESVLEHSQDSEVCEGSEEFEESIVDIETPPAQEHVTSLQHARLAAAEDQIANLHTRLAAAEDQIAKLSLVSNEKQVKVVDKGAISLFMISVILILLWNEGSLQRGVFMAYELAYPFINMSSQQIISVYTEHLCPLAYAAKAYILRKSHALQNAWKLLKE